MLNFGHAKFPMSANSPSSIVRFGTFEVNLQTGELRHRGQRVKLQEQPLQVLAALLERPGEIITREELRGKLWSADTFVDFDHSLNAAIKRLRDALGESADAPVFIETLARRGYRFIGNVEIPAAKPSARPRLWQRLFNRRNVGLGALTAGVLALPFVFYNRPVSSKAGKPTVTPIVTNFGEKHSPSLSPDGQHLAFAWNRGAGPDFSIYVKLVGTEESLRLTNQASIDFNPVWSPDGRYIAFCRFTKGGEKGIYIISALGGAERRVRSTRWREHSWSADRLSWSPDGRLLAFSDRASEEENTPSIFMLTLDSLEVRRLTSPERSRSDTSPVFSPDGQTLAFYRGPDGVYTVPVSGGEEKRLTSPSFGWGLAWTPDGHNIVFPDAGWLWKIFLRGGEPERLQFGQEGFQPSIRGNRLAYVRQTANLNIWRRKLDSTLSASPPDRFISSTRVESAPQFSPDGSKVAFESTRSGAYEIWVCRGDGSSPIQVTHLNSVSGTPRWSPDGQRIAFDSRGTGNADIFVMDSQGSPPQKIAGEPSHEILPSFSRDGHWVYFASNRTGAWQVWKVRLTGGLAVQVTRQGGFAAFESSDGRFLYYAKGPGVPGLWRIPTNGGEEIEVIGSLEAGYWGYWAVVENGIYYLDTTAKPGITFFNTTTHRTTRVFDLENRPAIQAPGLAVSSDKKTILYTQLDTHNSDIILVENFR